MSRIPCHLPCHLYHVSLLFYSARRHYNVIHLIFLHIFSPGIGQPLSLLLKLNPAVTKLNLYDIVHTPGVAADLSHCETASETTGFKGQDQIEASLAGAEIVVIPAGESSIKFISI